MGSQEPPQHEFSPRMPGLSRPRPRLGLGLGKTPIFGFFGGLGLGGNRVSVSVAEKLQFLSLGLGIYLLYIFSQKKQISPKKDQKFFRASRGHLLKVLFIKKQKIFPKNGHFWSFLLYIFLVSVKKVSVKPKSRSR